MAIHICSCGRNPLAMVLVPIRELARQVEKGLENLPGCTQFVSMEALQLTNR